MQKNQSPAEATISMWEELLDHMVTVMAFWVTMETDLLGGDWVRGANRVRCAIGMAGMAWLRALEVAAADDAWKPAIGAYVHAVSGVCDYNGSMLGKIARRERPEKWAAKQQTNAIEGFSSAFGVAQFEVMELVRLRGGDDSKVPDLARQWARLGTAAAVEGVAT